MEIHFSFPPPPPPHALPVISLDFYFAFYVLLLLFPFFPVPSPLPRLLFRCPSSLRFGVPQAGARGRTRRDSRRRCAEAHPRGGREGGSAGDAGSKLRARGAVPRWAGGGARNGRPDGPERDRRHRRGGRLGQQPAA